MNCLLAILDMVIASPHNVTPRAIKQKTGIADWTITRIASSGGRIERLVEQFNCGLKGKVLLRWTANLHGFRLETIRAEGKHIRTHIDPSEDLNVHIHITLSGNSASSKKILTLVGKLLNKERPPKKTS